MSLIYYGINIIYQKSEIMVINILSIIMIILCICLLMNKYKRFYQTMKTRERLHALNLSQNPTMCMPHVLRCLFFNFHQISWNGLLYDKVFIKQKKRLRF
uniref:Uncharacterized protein n=1 Tax=Rhizophora mucronata TaxID=61149 RepID=A0A2P2M8J6_RHIMU